MSRVSPTSEFSPFLSTSRLYLREVRHSDVAGNYYHWMNDPEITQFLESRYTPQSRESLTAYVEDHRNCDDELFLAICLQDDDRHIGNIKVGPINWIHGYADIGILVGEKNCWGHGFASEAIRLICTFSFNVLNIRKLTAGAYANNVGSIRAFEKVGFSREGLIRGKCLMNGQPVDLVLLGLLADEFQSVAVDPCDESDALQS